MTQQEGIMQDVYTFAGTYQWQLPYSYICKSTYYNKSCRPSTWNGVRNALGTFLEHLIISKLLDGSDSYMVWL